MADLENLREPSEEAMARFSDEDSYQPYAHRAHLRWRALAYYLWRFARVGHEAAALETCARFGHELRGSGGRCERCGSPPR